MTPDELKRRIERIDGQLQSAEITPEVANWHAVEYLKAERRRLLREYGPLRTGLDSKALGGD
jgi:hypothetical protein